MVSSNVPLVRMVPTRMMPFHCQVSQARPARKVPKDPPMKWVVMKIVLIRLEAEGHNSMTLV